MVDVILDSAGQKGTGKWTSQSALDLGVPLSIITESVFSRFLSAMKEERVAASKLLKRTEDEAVHGGQEGVYRTSSQGAVREQDLLLCARLRPNARRFRGVRLESALRRHRDDLPRRLHHSRAVPAEHQGCLRPRSRASQPAAGSIISKTSSKTIRTHGAKWSRRRSRTASRCRHSPARWRITIATAANGCRPTCCKRSATTSARIRSSGWTRKARSIIQWF